MLCLGDQKLKFTPCLSESLVIMERAPTPLAALL